jgi:hypothetical protein
MSRSPTPLTRLRPEIGGVSLSPFASIDEQGNVVATFNETCHHYGVTVATVRLRAPLAPVTLQGTEVLAIYAKTISRPVLTVEASDPSGSEIRKFTEPAQSAVYLMAPGLRW